MLTKELGVMTAGGSNEVEPDGIDTQNKRMSEYHEGLVAREKKLSEYHEGLVAREKLSRELRVRDDGNFTRGASEPIDFPTGGPNVDIKKRSLRPGFRGRYKSLSKFKTNTILLSVYF